jgi:type II secretory pathway component GspD/PulD (secretin)
MRVSLYLLFLISSLSSLEEMAPAPVQLAEELPAIESAPLIAEAHSFFKKDPPKTPTPDGYTINYNTVSIIEYIRFASKICKINFIYDEADLNFTVTVVSDEPVTPANVMATLVQVLRIHGLLLLEQDNNLVIHKSLEVKQMATLVTNGEQSGRSPIVTRIFRIKNAKPESIAAIIQPMISSSAILETSPETRQLILTDVTANVAKIAALIENLDSPHTLLEIKSYPVIHNKPEFLIELGSQIMNPIAQGNPFILVPQNLANEIFIVSTPDLVEKTLAVFTNLDTPPKVDPSSLKKVKAENIFVYKVVNRPGDDILKGLSNIAKNIQASAAADPDLIQAIDTAKWIRETNSLMFIGTPESIEKAKEFLVALDVPTGTATYQEKTSFFVYKPQYRSADEVEKSIIEMAHNLKGTKGADDSLIETISSVKINPLTHTLSFSGEEKNFDRIRQLLSTIDASSGKVSAPAIPPSTQFYIYKPVNQTGEQLVGTLKEVLSQLKADKLADPALLNALSTMKWVKATNSLMFTGDPGSLQKIQTLMTTFDIGMKPEVKPGYFIYKVQHTTGDLIEEDLDALAKNFKSSGLKDAKILDVIGKMRYVKQTNSLLLSGDPQGIDEVKLLIAQYDYPHTASAIPANSNFFMYKPQNVHAPQIEKSLKDIGTNLKNAGLADPSLLKTIDSIKYVDTTNSLIFTGPPDALQKIQGLVKEIDVPPAVHAPIQHVGKTTFLLYKLKYASGPQIVTSLKNMTSELKKTGTSDKDFLAALNSIKYVKETNSLFFSGNEEALNKIQALVEKFDVSSLAAKPETPLSTTGPSNFFVYKPQSLAGPDLQKILSDFAENLASSGLNDPELFTTIRSTRWTEATQTLVFTGTPKAIDQVKELLKQFDIPSNLPSGPAIAGSLESSIQAIDNTSFLVYKLQFHKGDEIQGALRQIAKDLIISNAPVNQGLLNSINSIQWLEVTNSLLSSGDQETLTRLRELVKNLDIPLKQVYIEMLVIQTTLVNTLNFGLEWGANYKYRNKFGAGSYNSQPINQSPGTPDTFMQNLSNLNPGTVPPAIPTPIGNIPVASGFDLGIIGEVIKHNGQTFLTLGSFLTALQTDDETSIIMTPKIITQDGRTSSIFVGENIPFVGSFVQNNGQNVVNTSNLEYRDIGFSLTVTPVLGNSDIVTLDINLDRSQTVGDVTGQLNLNSGTANGITTTKTTMQTTVHVPDNNFLILSGMVNNTNVKGKAGIPCLGGLPLIGAAFSKNNDTVVGSNIVIFIRPHIINSVDDMRRISSKEEDYFRDQAGTPFLERNFDEGMELIKTIDDE